MKYWENCVPSEGGTALEVYHSMACIYGKEEANRKIRTCDGFCFTQLFVVSFYQQQKETQLEESKCTSVNNMEYHVAVKIIFTKMAWTFPCHVLLLQKKLHRVQFSMYMTTRQTFE